MTKSLCAYWAGISLLLVSGGACSGSADASPISFGVNKLIIPVALARQPKEYARLIKKLRAQGGAVTPTKVSVRQPFFRVLGRIMKINNEAIQVFEYSNSLATQSQAKRVSLDGRQIGNSKPSWMSTPHFFKTQKLIVLYVGDNQTILRILQSELGDQFAGG